jgi:hypothetical protein
VRPLIAELLAVDDGGRFVVVWQSSGQDGANDGVFAPELFSTLLVMDVDLNGKAAALADATPDSNLGVRQWALRCAGAADGPSARRNPSASSGVTIQRRRSVSSF